MTAVSQFLSSRWGPIATGIAVGVLAPILVKLGNPGNMGICVACFSRDIAGALGLQRVATVQYIRPEIIGFVLGSLVAALDLPRVSSPRTGSAPLVRFLLGIFAAIGALVFLGCTWRAFLRLGGGDWNAIFGILGLVRRRGSRHCLFAKGFSARTQSRRAASAGLGHADVDDCILLALVFAPQFGAKDAQGNPTGPIFFSIDWTGQSTCAIA